MEQLKAIPALQRQSSMNSKRSLLVPQKTNLKFDLSDLDGLGNVNAPDSESLANNQQPRELKPKLSHRKLPSGKLQPLEDQRIPSNSGGILAPSSRTSSLIFPEAQVFTVQSKVSIDSHNNNNKEYEEHLQLKQRQQENQYIENFLEDVPKINLSKEDSGITRTRVIEEMYRIQARSQITPEERKQLYQIAMTMDAPKLARKIVADGKDQLKEETTGPFLTNDYLDSEPTSEAELVDDDDASSILSGRSSQSGLQVHTRKSLRPSRQQHSTSSSAAINLQSAVDDDELFCKAFDEVERIRKRMLQRASNTPSSESSSQFPVSAPIEPVSMQQVQPLMNKHHQPLDLPIQIATTLQQKQQPSPRINLSPRTSSFSHNLGTLSGTNHSSSTYSSIGSSMLATPRDQLQVQHQARSSNTNTFQISTGTVPSIQQPTMALTPRDELDDSQLQSTVVVTPLSRTPEDHRLKAPMPSEVLATLDDLIGANTPHTARSIDSNSQTSRNSNNPPKKTMRISAGMNSSNGNSSVGSKESDSVMGKGEAGNRPKRSKPQKQSSSSSNGDQSNAAPSTLQHSFSFHDPFLKPKDEQHLKPSKEQLKRLQSVDKNLQLINRQFSSNMNEGDVDSDGVHSRYASPIKKAPGSVPPQPNQGLEDEDDFDDLISGEYINKLQSKESNQVEGIIDESNSHSNSRSSHGSKKNLQVITKEDFDNFSSTVQQPPSSSREEKETDHARKRPPKLLPPTQTATPVVSSSSPTPMVNPTATARHRHLNRLHQQQQPHNNPTHKRALSSPLNDWMEIGMSLESAEHHQYPYHSTNGVVPLTSGSDMSTASGSQTVIDDSPTITSSPSNNKEKRQEKGKSDGRRDRRFSFEKEDIEKHGFGHSSRNIRQNPVLLSSLELLRASQVSQLSEHNSPQKSGSSMSSGMSGFDSDQHHFAHHSHHHQPRHEVIQNVKRTLHTLQENISRASLSPVNRGNHGANPGLTMSFQSHYGGNLLGATTNTLGMSQNMPDGMVTPSYITVGGFTRQSSEAGLSAGSETPSHHRRDQKQFPANSLADFIRPATTSSIPGTVQGEVPSGRLGRNSSSAVDDKQLISQSMVVDSSSAASISDELNSARPYSQPIYKPPLMVRQPSGLSVGIASSSGLSTNSPMPSGISSKENGPKLSALRNAGGFLLSRENSKTNSPASFVQQSSFAPTAAASNAKDPSSRMFALAAALDAGDAVGKLMADMVVSAKHKR